MAEVDDQELYPLIVALKRLSAFAEYHDISGYDLVKNTLTILKWVNDNEGFQLDFITKALNLARCIISWNLQKLYSDLEEARNTHEATLDSTTANTTAGEFALSAPLREQMEYVAKLSKKFYKICSKLLVNENAHIEEEAFYELCDLFLQFNMHLAGAHPECKSLILECTTNDIYMLSSYVINNVFTPEALTEKPGKNKFLIFRF